MKELPSNVNPYMKTKVFSQDEIPKPLLKNHQTKEKTWGVINVVEGELLYIIGEDATHINPDRPGIVEPEILHHVKALGPVKFFVEFDK